MGFYSSLYRQPCTFCYCTLKKKRNVKLLHNLEIFYLFLFVFYFIFFCIKIIRFAGEENLFKTASFFDFFLRIRVELKIDCFVLKA